MYAAHSNAVWFVIAGFSQLWRSQVMGHEVRTDDLREHLGGSRRDRGRAGATHDQVGRSADGTLVGRHTGDSTRIAGRRITRCAPRRWEPESCSYETPDSAP